VPSRLARICCLDLDTFFVSVERLLDLTLAQVEAEDERGAGQ